MERWRGREGGGGEVERERGREREGGERGRGEERKREREREGREGERERGGSLTIRPPPHCDTVLGVQPDREEQLPITTEVNTGHTNGVGALQNGEGLFGVEVPHVDGCCLTKLA